MYLIPRSISVLQSRLRKFWRCFLHTTFSTDCSPSSSSSTWCGPTSSTKWHTDPSPNTWEPAPKLLLTRQTIDRKTLHLTWCPFVVFRKAKNRMHDRKQKMIVRKTQMKAEKKTETEFWNHRKLQPFAIAMHCLEILAFGFAYILYLLFVMFMATLHK